MFTLFSYLVERIPEIVRDTAVFKAEEFVSFIFKLFKSYFHVMCINALLLSFCLYKKCFPSLLFTAEDSENKKL